MLVTPRENGKIWSSDQDLARKRARKTSYYTNILVVKGDIIVV
jgi:hypothetical protein